MSSPLVSHLNGRMLRWSFFYGLVLAAWGLLYLTHLPRLETAMVFGWDYWKTVCAADSQFPVLAAMWGLMAAAMMAPAAIPMLKTYDDLIHAGAGTTYGFWALTAGYISVWVAFSLIAAIGQQQLSEVGLVAVDGSSTSAYFSAALLFVAGIYQFSPLKDACLKACRSPLLSFMGDWRPGAWAAFLTGLREGAWCLGCCWALMSLAFVAGTMNLVFMGLAMILMVVEKLPDIGVYITRPLGAVLLAAAGWFVIA